MRVFAGGSVIVTGGGSGIGREICLRLANQALVGVLDNSEQGANETVSLIEAAGGKTIALNADVTDSKSVEAAFSKFDGFSPSLGAVIACAGVERLGAVAEEPESNWDFVISVNAKGVYLCARSAYQRFIKQNKGNFLVISSDAGFTGTSEFGIYTASKHAVVGLVKSLALDFGHLGIRANALCPGNVQTPMMDEYLEQNPAEAEYWYSVVPMGRFATTEELAAAAEFLVSEESSFVSGSVFVVDGSAAFYNPDA